MKILRYIFPIMACAMVACEPDTVCNLKPNIVCVTVMRDTLNKEIARHNDTLSLNDTIQAIHCQGVPVTIHYTNNPIYVSMACGCFVYHTISDAETDSIERYIATITNSSVENQPQENVTLIRLY